MDTDWCLLILMQNGIGSKALVYVAGGEGMENNGVISVSIERQKFCLLQILSPNLIPKIHAFLAFAK